MRESVWRDGQREKENREKERKRERERESVCVCVWMGGYMCKWSSQVHPAA